MVLALTVRFHPTRGLMLVVVAIGIVAIGLSWAKVAQTFLDAKPSIAPVQPSAIVWSGRVFQSRAELTRWLHSRGATYVAWRQRYPTAAAVLEHRPPPAAKPAARPAEPVAAPAGAVAPASTASGGHGVLRALILALLVAAAAVCAAAAALPAFVLQRHPAVARAVVPHRELLIGGAAALTVGVLVGALMT
jgi:hypothetical protein